MSDPASDPRAELVATAFDAFNRGDLDGVSAFLHPAVRSHVSPKLMNAGSWEGRQGFFEMVGGWIEAFTETTYEILDIQLLDDRFLVARVRQTSLGRESGVPVKMEPSYLMEISEGKAVAIEIHPDHQSAAEAWQAHCSGSK